MNLIELPILLCSGINPKWHKVSDHSIDMGNLLLTVNIKSWVEKRHAVLDSQPVFESELDIQLSNWSEEYLNDAFLLPYISERLPYILTRDDPVNKFCAWNWLTKEWEDPRTLTDLKIAQWTVIKQARSAAEYAGFMWDGSTFDSDALSQNRIAGAVTLAQLSSSFTIDWILADNTVRTLNQISMLQVGAALGEHVAAVFANGVLRRAQIETATTLEEIEAVVW